MGGARFRTKKRIVVDIDGVLAENVDLYRPNFNDAVYKRLKPKKDAIRKINWLYNKYLIILYTGRSYDRLEVTIWWLKKNKVRYHHLVMGKPKADLYIDDRAIFYNENWVKVVK